MRMSLDVQLSITGYKTDLDEEATWVLETVVNDKFESLSEKEKLSLLEELGGT